MKCKNTYGSMEAFRKYRNRSKQTYYRSRDFSKGKKKRRWKTDEIEMVMEHKQTDTEIAQKLGRSVRAVQAMRHKQKVMQDA